MGVKNGAIEAELKKRTELLDELRNLLTRLLSDQHGPTGGSVVTATHSVSQRTATIRSTSTSVTKMHYQRTAAKNPPANISNQHELVPRAQSLKPIEARGSGDYVLNGGTAARSQMDYCQRPEIRGQFSVPRQLGHNVRSSHGHEHVSQNMANGQYTCGHPHGSCGQNGLTSSPTVANLLGLVDSNEKQVR